MKNGNGFVITKDTWDRTPEQQRDWIMFETVQSMHFRLKTLEHWNKSLSFVGGMVGGVAAVITFKICGG